MTPGAGFWFPTISAVLGKPHLWLTAARQFRRAVPARWWAHAPYVPRPDADYVRFRLETAYGARGIPSADDVVRYLEWCRASG
jgi:hypothetical protein